MVGTEPDETEELIEKGSIPTSTYVTYFKAGNSIIVLGILVVIILVSQVLCNASDMWITHWYVFFLNTNSFCSIYTGDLLSAFVGQRRNLKILRFITFQRFCI